MRITTKGRYGLRAVVNLAAQSEGEPVPLSRIAREEEVSSQFLEQIFFSLKRAGLVRSVRGPRGGFILSRPADEITVSDILAAVDESLLLVPCTSDGEQSDCGRKDECPTYPMWRALSELLQGFFGGITIQHLVDRNSEPLQRLSAS